MMGSLSYLNHWPSATLNQRAVGWTPTRPTKTINRLGKDSGGRFSGSEGRCKYGASAIQHIDLMILSAWNPPRGIFERDCRLGVTEVCLKAYRLKRDRPAASKT